MNLGDIDFGLENWPTDVQIENEMETHAHVFLVVHPIMTFGHSISAYTDIIKVPTEWVHYDCGRVKVKSIHYEDVKKVLQEEVEWLKPKEYASYQANQLQTKSNVNEMLNFELVTTDMLRQILHKYEENVVKAMEARKKWKEFANLL